MKDEAVSSLGEVSIDAPDGDDFDGVAGLSGLEAAARCMNFMVNRRDDICLGGLPAGCAAGESVILAGLNSDFLTGCFFQR